MRLKMPSDSNLLQYLMVGVLIGAVTLGFVSWAMIDPTNSAVQITATLPSPAMSPVPSPTPIPSGIKSLKVYSVGYYPIERNRLDTHGAIQDGYDEYNFSLSEVRSRVSSIEKETEKALESGAEVVDGSLLTTYIDYQVVGQQEFLEAVPLSGKKYNGLRVPDYLSMMKRIDICHLVDEKDIREVWLWTYGGTGKAGWTSNLSSKYGDISNSDRDDNDLPHCKHSYTVYDYNYGRTAAEAVHDHTLQYEALFGYLDDELFWQQFAGRAAFIGTAQKTAPVGCGWTNVPPNGQKDFDYSNSRYVKTHCGDWTVLDKKEVQTNSLNCTEWNCDHLDYLVWWMKKLPSYKNTATYQGKKLRNWWDFVVDFDQAMAEGQSLTK